MMSRCIIILSFYHSLSALPLLKCWGTLMASAPVITRAPISATHRRTALMRRACAQADGLRAAVCDAAGAAARALGAEAEPAALAALAAALGYSVAHAAALERRAEALHRSIARPLPPSFSFTACSPPPPPHTTPLLRRS